MTKQAAKQALVPLHLPRGVVVSTHFMHVPVMENGTNVKNKKGTKKLLTRENRKEKHD